MALRVQKFGGTSVGDTDRIRAVADHISRTLRSGDQVVAVVSAMGKTTDDLIHLASEVSSAPPPREYDMLVSVGERISMTLAVHGAGRLRRPRRVLHRQPGRNHHRHRPHQGQDRRGQGGPPARRPGQGRRPRGRRLPGGVHRAGRDHPRPGWLRHDGGRGRRGAERGRLRDLHGRDRCLQRRPPDRARSPAARPGRASRRCSRWRPPAGGCSCCGPSSSPATTRCPSTCDPASRGSPVPGSPRRIRPWSRPSSPR